MMPTTRIGISGWRYVPWRNHFYPKKLPQKDELHYASRQLNSIEINGTFYSLQRPSSFQTWYAQTPEDFVFSVKCPRFITHMRRLKNIEEPLANFFASGVLALREKLGPFLWQLPPNFKFDELLLGDFFDRLPRDIAGAEKLAGKASSRMDNRTLIPKQKNRKVRYAIEIRHESFCTAAFIRLLRRQKVALVIADTAGLHPFAEDVTADFLYVRLHGHEKIYASGYSDRALEQWAARLAAWQRGSEPNDAHKILDLAPPKKAARDLYLYFDNDIKVYAPFNAIALAKLMGG